MLCGLLFVTLVCCVCLLFAYYVLFVVSCLLLGVCCPLVGVYCCACSPWVVCCLSCVDRCLVVCCLLIVVCCVLFVVGCVCELCSVCLSFVIEFCVLRGVLRLLYFVSCRV